MGGGSMMAREVGKPTFPIWLLGDSEPAQWRKVLATPLDPRHPIRHNIWTSVADVVQGLIYGKCGKRLETDSTYIRNAIQDSAIKPPPGLVSWDVAVEAEVTTFCDLVAQHHPKLILSFGAFAFEFGRRAIEIVGDPASRKKYQHWGARNMGQEFRRRVSAFKFETPTTLLPLLHRSVAGGSFLSSHKQFCANDAANYFLEVGTALGEILLVHRDKLDCWAKPGSLDAEAGKGNA
jgi:hypothetical protein